MYEVQQSKLKNGSSELECAFSQKLSNAEIQFALRRHQAINQFAKGQLCIDHYFINFVRGIWVWVI